MTIKGGCWRPVALPDFKSVLPDVESDGRVRLPSSSANLNNSPFLVDLNRSCNGEGQTLSVKRP